MAWINEEDLKAIRAKADIADIISQYMPIEKKGKEYVGVCPFHDDHSPSMHISTDKQIFKCFSCGAGGDVFGFVSRIDNLTFPEAAAKVAELAGYDLHLSKDAFKKKESPLKQEYACMKDYITFLNYELHTEEGLPALDYLEKRKTSDEVMDMFEIGYAPADADSMRFLTHKGYDLSKLEEIGLLKETDGILKPVFYRRIMIPIHDAFGNPVGFTARRLESNPNAPKYINSSASILYDKSKLVFNYHRAKAHARKARRVILCEGAMDVIGFAKAGIYEAVANLGTACSSEQLQLIKALKVPVTVCYDSDAAGKNACYLFCQKALAAGISLQICKNDLSKDPDDVYIRYGAEELRKMSEKTISYPEFLFDYLPEKYSLQNYEDKTQLARELSAAINACTSQFEKETYFARLKKLTGFVFESQSAPKVYKKPPRQAKGAALLQYLPKIEQGSIKAERVMLCLMLNSKQAAAAFRQEIGFFSNEELQQLSLYIYDLYRKSDSIDQDSLLAAINTEDIRMLAYELEQNPYHLNYEEEKLLEDTLNKIKDSHLAESIEKINREIAALSDPVLKMEKAREKAELISKRHAIHSSH